MTPSFQVKLAAGNPPLLHVLRTKLCALPTLYPTLVLSVIGAYRQTSCYTDIISLVDELTPRLEALKEGKVEDLARYRLIFREQVTNYSIMTSLTHLLWRR